MTEVLFDNFNQLLPDIIQSINSARFIAIDTEFTALYLDEHTKPSLFDDGEKRYNKLWKTVQYSMPIQVGLSLFEFIPNRNTYQAHTYTFYIWPKPIMSINHLVKIQGSTFQFLSRFDFDYNKLFYHGVPFLTQREEAQLFNDLQSSNRYLDSSIEQYIKDISIEIKAWLAKAKVDAADAAETFTVASSKGYLKYDIDARYQVQYEIRKAFKGRLWTEINDQHELVVQSVSETTFAELLKNDTLISKTMHTALGFSLLYKALVAAKKPIVGHNMLMDLLLLMNTFGEALPRSYKQFKKTLHKTFPCLVDTKCLSYVAIKAIPRNMEWQRNTLQSLYEYFLKGRGKKLSYNVPLVRTDLVLEMNHYHHAGWDSYCTGFVFVRMAHLLVTKNLGVKSHKIRDIMSSEHFGAAEPVRNQLNLIRASVAHINICEADPKSRRPSLLVAVSLNNDLDTSQVLLALSEYGYADIQSISSSKALIAVPTKEIAKNILAKVTGRSDFIIEKYSFISRHKYEILAISLLTSFMVGAYFGFRNRT